KLGAVLGTIDYMSPEQIQGGAIDRRADLYAAGVMLYEMLSGRKPFEGTSEFDVSAAHVQRAPDLSVLTGRCPAALVEVVARALAKQPDSRFDSASAMATALARALVPEAQPPIVASAQPPTVVPTQQDESTVDPPAPPAVLGPAPPVAPVAVPAEAKPRTVVVLGSVVGAVAVLVIGAMVLRAAGLFADSTPAEVAPASAPPEPVAAPNPPTAGPIAPPTAAPAHLTWSPGSRLIYRYRVDSTASKDELIARDHFVERRVETATPQLDGSVHVQFREQGGPDGDARKFTEVYAAAGVGDLRGGGELRAAYNGRSEKWQVPGGGAEDVSEAVGASVRVLLHPRLGKVFEQSTDDRGSVRTLDLVAFAIGSQTGGDLATDIVRCQWFESKGSKSWLKEPGAFRTLELPGALHAFTSAVAVRRETADTASVLNLSGAEASHVLSFGADLLVVKAWAPPAGAMAWVASVWRTAASTCLVLSRLTILGAADTVYCHGSADVRDLTDDHFLHMVQQGSTCVAALGVRAGAGRLAALYSLPTTENSARLGGSWSENDASLVPAGQ
ncbi:MAG: hypothetical protein EXR79_17520, partial [Myxococcales bacterium]|nr:hypothetical protein [Myxococcales bacterium]